MIINRHYDHHQENGSKMEQELQNQLDIKNDHLNEANKKNAKL